MLLDTKDIKNDKNTPKNTKEIYFKLGEELAKAQSKAAKLHYKQCKAKLMTGFLASLTCTFTSEVTSRSKLDQAIQKKICESNSKADNGITIVGLAWDGMSYQTEDQKKKETQNTQETRKELSFSSR